MPRTGPGPRPTVPSHAVARQAAEGLIDRLVRDFDEEGLDGVPDPENLLAVIQFARSRRRAEVPLDDDVVDRLTLIRYIEDVLQREKLAALEDGRRGRVPQLRLSQALGKTSKQASGVERVRLAAQFAERETDSSGTIRRGSKDAKAFVASTRADRQVADWSAGNEHQLAAAAEALVLADFELAEDGMARIVLDALPDDVDWARSSGNWEPVARRLLAAAGHLEREAPAARLPAGVEHVVLAIALVIE